MTVSNTRAGTSGAAKASHARTSDLPAAETRDYQSRDPFTVPHAELRPFIHTPISPISTGRTPDGWEALGVSTPKFHDTNNVT